jgi:hypothetical protein
MMRWTVAALSIAGAILVLPSPVQAQTDNSGSPVSIERIRAALKGQPSLLQISEPPGDTPTFHVEVRGPIAVLQPIDEKPFDPTFGLPSLGELLMDGVEKIGSAVIDYKRHRAESRARKEVDDALEAFCAVQKCPRPDTSK